jgi:hypothetical protein
MQAEGACHCGAIAYEADIDPATAESGNRRAQAFCAECGTRLYAAAEKDPQIFNLRVGTIRQRAGLRPVIQLWCRSALPWVHELGSVPWNAKQP